MTTSLERDLVAPERLFVLRYVLLFVREGGQAASAPLSRDFNRRILPPD